MPTTVLATALPHSLADDAPFQLTVFVTHKLIDGPAEATLANFPAAADWVTTLAGCTLSLTTSLDPNALLPLRMVSAPDAAAWVAVLPPTIPAGAFPTPKLSDETWRTNPASRMSDHAVDLHVAAMTAAPTRRPRLAGDPVAGGLLQTFAGLDEGGPLRRLLEGEPARPRRALEVQEQRMRDALTTIGPLTERDETDPERGHGGEIEPPPPYQSRITDEPSPVQVLLDDPEADHRVTRRLDALVGQDLSADPQLQLIVDAHAMRRYYERPEQPQQVARQEPNPDAPPTPRPDRPEHDFHARVGSFGATPALLRRLGLAIDVVLDGVDAAGARAALAGANWVSVTVTSPAADLEVLPPRRTAVVVDGDVFAARSSSAWVGGALPLGEDEWVVLDVDPDASGLKLDQHLRNLVRQYASEANGDPATSAPGTLRSTGFALARRDRAAQLRGRVQEAEKLAADDGTRELLLDDLVRGIRVEVWDDRTKEWHSLHRRLATVTGEGNPRRVRVGGRAGHRVPAAVGAQPPAREPDEGLLPPRGRRRLGRLEPVRPAARTDDRARRAAGPGRRHRGGRRVAARRSDRGRAHDGAGRAVVVAAVAVRDVVQLPGPRGGLGGQLGAAGAAPSPAPDHARRSRRDDCPHAPRAASIALHRARSRGRCRSATRGRDRTPADTGARRCPAARRAALRRRAHRRDARRSGCPGGRRAARRDRGAARLRRRRRRLAGPCRVARDLARAAAATDRPRRVRPAHPQRRPPAPRRAAATGAGDRHHSAPVPAVGAGPSAGARRPPRARHG